MTGEPIDNAWNPDLENMATEGFRRAASALKAPVVAPVRAHFQAAAHYTQPSSRNEMVLKR